MTDEDLTPEEEAAEKAEWISYVPEMKLAIEVGYLDDQINELFTALMERRKEVGTTLKVKRKPSIGSNVAAQGVAGSPVTFTTIPAPHATYADVVAGKYNPANYPSHVKVGNDYFTKHDIASAGSKMMAAGLTFELKGARKYGNCHFELDKVNKTRAIVRVVRVDGYSSTARIGQQVTVPLDWLVRSMREVPFPTTQV